jgi:hypothetical protein
MRRCSDYVAFYSVEEFLALPDGVKIYTAFGAQQTMESSKRSIVRARLPGYIRDGHVVWGYLLPHRPHPFGILRTGDTLIFTYEHTLE